jgi:hypothetical protein
LLSTHRRNKKLTNYNKDYTLKIEKYWEILHVSEEERRLFRDNYYTAGSTDNTSMLKRHLN